MVDIHVLNQDFTLEGIIYNYSSLIWRPSYSDVGDFELYMAVTPEAVNLLQAGRYLVRDIDIDTSGGVVTYRKVMIIKNLEISTDAESGDYLTVTGRELKYLLHQRIVWSQTNLTGTVESCIRKLITLNAISPTLNSRKIPTLKLLDEVGFTDTIDTQVTGDPLDEAIINLCKTYDYGWEIYISNNALVFYLYRGLDRSYNQTDRPYVVFSDDFKNIDSSEYQLNTENYCNTALIGGEGEGTARKFATVNNTASGLDRFEMFVDARDISQNSDSTDETEVISDEEYLNLLVERGKEKLSEAETTEGFSGEILSDVTYKFGTDFFLGDTVTVINKYGISKNVKVLSAIESIDENGSKLVPEFNG